MTASQAGSTPGPASGTASGTAMTPVASRTVPVGSVGSGGAVGSGAAHEWLMDLGALGFTGLLVGVIVLIRRWLVLRRRRPLPGLPPEPVLPFFRHGTLHDPKYLGRMLEAEKQSKQP